MRLLGGLLFLGVCLLPPVPALALSTGITGSSGRQGSTCNASQCHGDGVAPEVQLVGPQEVPAGALATFSFVVASLSLDQNIGGLNVAANGGELGIAPEEGVRLELGEITHDFPKQAIDGVVGWQFGWRAPAEAGTYVLYGAGLSANGNGNRSGDRASATTFSIQVTPAPLAGDASCDGMITAADLTALVRVSPAGVPEACELADADCDGEITAGDVASVIGALFDPEPLPACEAL